MENRYQVFKFSENKVIGKEIKKCRWSFYFPEHIVVYFLKLSFDCNL